MFPATCWAPPPTLTSSFDASPMLSAYLRSNTVALAPVSRIALTALPPMKAPMTTFPPEMSMVIGVRGSEAPASCGRGGVGAAAALA